MNPLYKITCTHCRYINRFNSLSTLVLCMKCDRVLLEVEFRKSTKEV